MVSADVIARRVLSLNQAVLQLDAHVNDLSAERLAAEPMLQAAIERWVQISIEACIDMSYHVVAERGWTPPDTARGAFELLGANGIIAPQLAVKLGLATGLRNILVHEYASVDRALLVAAVKSGLTDLRAFGAAIGSLLAAELP